MIRSKKSSSRAFFLAITFLIHFSGAAAVARESYNLDFSLEDVTKNELHGHYQLELKVQSLPPTLAEILSMTSQNENGENITSKLFRLNGEPLFRYETHLYQITKTSKKEIAQGTTEVGMISLFPPVSFPAKFEFQSPVNLFIATKAPTIQNEPALWTLRVVSEHSLQVEKLGKNPPVNALNLRTPINLSLTVMPQKPFATEYQIVGRYLPTIAEVATPCEVPGHYRQLPQNYGNDLRVEYCYPSSDDPRGFERIVLPLTGVQGMEPKVVSELTKRILYPPMRQAIKSKCRSQVAKPLFTVSAQDKTNMNCHGYAVRATADEKSLFLPKNAFWLEGSIPTSARYGMEGTYPFLTVLKNSYDQVAHFEIAIAGDFGSYTNLLKDPRLRPGDLLTFIDNQGYQHSAVLIEDLAAGELCLESKIDTGEIIDSSIEALAAVYSAKQIDIYRPKVPRLH